MSVRPLTTFAAAVAVLIVTSVFTPAHAELQSGTISGTIVLDKKAKRERPVTSKGFVERKKNAIRPVQPWDPRTEMVVVIMEGPVAEEDKTPPPRSAEYALIGESFEFPLMPVQIGVEVDITTPKLPKPLRTSPRLYSPDEPELDDSPVSPGGTRSVTMKTSFRAIRIKDRDSAHLIGRIVAFPHPYFSRLAKNGKFEITGVPLGEWKLRLWFRDGWVKGTDNTIEVDQVKKPTKVPTITLPASLEIEGDKGKQQKEP